jgi:hypothetical protein
MKEFVEYSYIVLGSASVVGAVALQTLQLRLICVGVLVLSTLTLMALDD